MDTPTPGARLRAVHPVLGSRDVARSIRFYASLGFKATWQDSPTQPRYAAVVRDGVELHIQWNDAAGGAGDQPVYRFPVREVDALHAEFRAGGEPLDMTEVFDSSWGTREFHVRDPDRNGLQFYWAK